MAEQTQENVSKAIYGVDFGTDGYTLSHLKSDSQTVDLLVNELSSRKSPVAVSFQGRRRLFGNHALDAANTNPTNTILRLLDASAGKEQFQTSQFDACQPLDNQDGSQVQFEVDYVLGDDTKAVLTTTQLLVTAWKDILNRIATHAGDSTDNLIVIAVVLPLASPTQISTFQQALAVAVKSLPAAPKLSVYYVDRAQGAEACYQYRYKLTPMADDGGATQTEGSQTEQTEKAKVETEEETEKETADHVAVVDMGHGWTSVLLLQVTDSTCACLARQSVPLGCRNVDEQLFEHIAQELSSKHGQSVQASSKAGARLLKACGKARKVLSANKQTDIVLEAHGEEGKDYMFRPEREQLEANCQHLIAQLQEAMQAVLTQANVTAEQVSGVELVGGGTCIPFVQGAADKVFGADKLRTTLDRTCAGAIGAAVLAGRQAEGAEAQSSKDVAQELVDVEVRMSQQDAAIDELHAARNALEAYIFDTRKLRNGDYADKFDSEGTMPLLEEAEDWLYSDEAEQAESADIYAGKMAQLKEKVEALNADVFAAIAQDQEAKDKQAALERAQWEAEAALEPKADKLQHDTRKLKKADRLKLVMRNKDEATELFKGGNYGHATERYIRALGHCRQFFDLTPEDQEEVDGVQATLHLNLAMCYIKQSAWKKAIHSCKESLTLKADSAKAHYRLAVAYEQLKDYEEGLKATKNGLRLAEGDAALTKLQTRLEAKEAKRKAQEKKMYSKMFG
eukprot:TRINITY_DN7113_c0_g1_i3.p1 TRINITY_DN7113_c0_g1~~TRINITY_DN7113_c0_g1_i3.p1  ORF type:complete len:737 (+),score=250.94 TRINITY_DN7113_c0_g1_i3:50-2260(+)